MHVIFVPYAIMKTDPASWLKMVTRFKGNSASLYFTLVYRTLIDKMHPYSCSMCNDCLTAAVALLKSHDMTAALVTSGAAHHLQTGRPDLQDTSDICAGISESTYHDTK